MRTILILTALANGFFASYSQSETKSFEKTIPIGNYKTILVDNIFGQIEILGKDISEVSVNAAIEMEADEHAQLANLVDNVQVRVEGRGDTLFIFDGSPWACSPMNQKRNCHFNWQSDRMGQYLITYSIHVPVVSNVAAATVNDGDILVKGIAGQVEARNVNGSVFLAEVGNVSRAKSINGDVTVEFSKKPSYDGEYYCLNGDISTSFPADLAADISFKSFNGEFYTDFSYQNSPVNSSLKKQNTSRGTKYKLEKSQGILIGNGGPRLKYETLNGNMYVRKK